MKKLITLALFFGSFGAVMAKHAAYDVLLNPDAIQRPEMCQQMTTKKMFVGCRVAPELSVRREKNKYCYFASSNESYCTTSNTGNRGDCYAAKQGSRGIVCMGTSFNSANKCRAVCEVSTSKPVCVGLSEKNCTGSAKNWYCIAEYKPIPTMIWGECKKTNEESCNLSEYILPNKTCKANDPYGCPAEYVCEQPPSGMPLPPDTPLVCIHKYIDGCERILLP